ncbi:hypothetical protein ACH4SP_29505 [Streptomyces sp. NPDC021093]|uniref:hypothetical protein n=1 Tax=Streptomyces sp. NPDC021093 TaxID=3365112 RepID=UPI003794233F
MSTATFTPGAAEGLAGTRTAGHGHSGATAVSDKPHRVARALRAVRIFAGAAVGVVLLGDYADEWKEDVRATADGRKPQDQKPQDWRRERDAWADGRMSGDR